jgi:hypothetical protein
MDHVLDEERIERRDFIDESPSIFGMAVDMCVLKQNLNTIDEVENERLAKVALCRKQKKSIQICPTKINR